MKKFFVYSLLFYFFPIEWALLLTVSACRSSFEKVYFYFYGQIKIFRWNDFVCRLKGAAIFLFSVSTGRARLLFFVKCFWQIILTEFDTSIIWWIEWIFEWFLFEFRAKSCIGFRWSLNLWFCLRKTDICSTARGSLLVTWIFKFVMSLKSWMIFHNFKDYLCLQTVCEIVCLNNCRQTMLFALKLSRICGTFPYFKCWIKLLFSGILNSWDVWHKKIRQFLYQNHKTKKQNIRRSPIAMS